ncbi:DUF1800 family protein [Mesorhizobium sp. B2-5-13]|uniref:DUF1800 domain-containing protein n=1 Tax=unclassified Mesorhizobium TaxID=325217 RepID=UPI00112BF844|nr:MULTISPECIES: DUF1800 family protein [unclassified Mesorhizobium]TPJ44763.1 DUF1800 family protein [Mesorhizobium sp. B2-6-5]TPJ91867.1 DUF1800 family protein [Mesorhizobium sp. B2-5-13]TPK53195.1 DUF1800 family protein [Mesorhizobium sp. B2-5-5]
MAAQAKDSAPPDPALIAFNRFGLGARPGDRDRLANDPRGYLKAELRRLDAAMISLDDPTYADLKGSTPAIQASMAANLQRKLDRERTATGQPATGTPASASAMPPPAAPGMSPAAAPAAAKIKPAVPPVEVSLFRAEAQARFDMAMQAGAGFVERLVYFWSNHFCVSVAKANIVRASAGAFEREAIRPFVLGRFADMLVAVERHPAMLFYLDNQQSIGPDSRAGKNRQRGLNENLAREILELHTLGVGSGYSQADVTSFARILTGWTMAGREGRLGEPGSSVFNANAHEPGDAVLLGKTYPAGGMGQAETALNDIARHPAAAQHIATQLARHFIADDPPPAAVARLAKVFVKNDGHLRALAAALIDLPEAWSTPLAKMRSPFDYVAAIRRAAGPGPNDPGQSLNWLNALGEPLWQPPGPNGFSDRADSWASAEGMKIRLDIAWQAARQVKDIGNPNDMLDAVIGPSASPETRQAVARAESKQQGLALLLMAPEFQRR